jgi:type IV pilus assembly protein PilM
MLQLFREPAPPIGLDLGSESVKMLQLTASAGGLRVGAALRVPLPDDVRGNPDRRVEFAGEVVRNALRQGTFRGRRVVAALPKELVHYKTHRLPPMSADELPMAARIDARDLFRFDPDSADVQCVDAGEVRQGEDRRREVILVAAGKQYVDQFVRELDRAGIVVASLEIDPTAVWRAARRVVPRDPYATHAGPQISVDSAGAGNPATFQRSCERWNVASDGCGAPRVLLDIGAAQSRLVIGRGDALRVIRTIDVGGDHLRNAISRKLGLSVAEAEQLRRRSAALAGEDGTAKKLGTMRTVLGDATRHSTELLAREVLACLRYHAVTFRGPAPRSVELVGGEATDGQIRSTLCATLLLPAKPADLFRGIDVTAIPSGQRTGCLGEWAVALGLALKSFRSVAAQPIANDPDEHAPDTSERPSPRVEAAKVVLATGGAS